MEKRKQYDNKIILPRAETHEFSKGKSGLVICENATRFIIRNLGIAICAITKT